jgi:hypothetical protein
VAASVPPEDRPQHWVPPFDEDAAAQEEAPPLEPEPLPQPDPQPEPELEPEPVDPPAAGPDERGPAEPPRPAQVAESSAPAAAAERLVLPARPAPQLEPLVSKWVVLAGALVLVALLVGLLLTR